MQVSARGLAGAGQDVATRTAEYQLRILGMSVEEARRVLADNKQKANEAEEKRPKISRQTKPVQVNRKK